MSSAALRRAEEAIDMMETWSGAVNVIKQVMDAVSPIAAVRNIILSIVLRAKTRSLVTTLCKPSMEPALKNTRGTSPCVVGVFTLFSSRFQTLIQQVQRDDNVRALFEAIRDAFQFARDADALRKINPESRQARILEEMLQCVSEIGKFIELYAKHVQVGKSS
jgi:hypothetical protein